MILVGIDDTDTLETPGTNQLARKLLAVLPPGLRARRILRHQLLVDPRIPYTSHNGSASILLDGEADPAVLFDCLAAEMRSRFVPGSDPGLCVATAMTDDVVRFARRCETEVVEQQEAREVARAAGVRLEGLGGTEQGVVGALAAVGLGSTGEDGRVVHLADWPWPDEMTGPQPFERVTARGVEVVVDIETDDVVHGGVIDVGKRLRPNLRGGRVVLYVASKGPDAWEAVRKK